MNTFLKTCRIASFAFLLLAVTSCERAPSGAYVPGLGEIMSATQMRHIKLWFAGQAGNWPLASYELDELQEGFDDAVKFHPVHKDAPLPISELLPELTGPPLQQLETAIAGRDPEKFEQAFNELTAACNQCHQTENFGFNVVVVPTENPYTDQKFEPVEPEVSGQ